MILSTRRFFSAIAASSLVVITAFTPTLSAAPGASAIGQPVGKHEQFLTTASPANAPVAIVAQRFAPGPNWLDGLSVDVLNTSEKPVYYVALLVESVDLKVEGLPIGFMLTWGNAALGTATELARISQRLRSEAAAGAIRGGREGFAHPACVIE